MRRPPTPSPTSSNGFTLVELLVCLVMLALLALLATPASHSLLERHRALAAEHSLVRHLNMTRMAAVTHRRPAVLCPSRDGMQCARGIDWNIGWLLFLDRDGDRMPDQPEDILRSEGGPSAPHLRLIGTRGRNAARYLPDGRSSGSNLTVSICNQGGELLAQVIVNNAGRVRSQRPRAPRPCPG